MSGEYLFVVAVPYLYLPTARAAAQEVRRRMKKSDGRADVLMVPVKLYERAKLEGDTGF